MAKEKKVEEYVFDIDLDRGLYLGAGTNIIPETNKDHPVEPVFIDWSHLAGHLVVYGTTRVGKTRLMVSLIRQCILNGQDIMVVEPKGSKGQETIAWILEFAEEADRLRDITYISPMFKNLSMAFNPVYGLSNEEIASLVSTLIPAKDDFYIVMGYTITFAILIGLEFIEKAEGKVAVGKSIEREFKRVYSGNSNIIDEEANLSDPDLSERSAEPKQYKSLEEIDPPYRTLVTFSDIATYSTQQGLNIILDTVNKITNEQYDTEDKKEIAELNRLKSEAIRAISEQAEKDQSYFSKVASSFNITIQQLSTGDLGEILCSTKINPVMDGFKNTNHGQILIVQPYPLKYKKASDAFVRVFFAMFTAAFGDIGAAGRVFPREIFLFIDEGGSVLYPGIEHLFNKAGGLGLRIMIFSQSFADYEAELGPELSKIVNDNTNTKIYMLMNDIQSREQVSASFGKVMMASAGYMGSKLDMRVSTGEAEKELLTSAHVAQMQKQEFLLQTNIGSYLCVAMSQPDPDYWVETPRTETEILYDDYASRYVTSIEKEELIELNELEDK